MKQYEYTSLDNLHTICNLFVPFDLVSVVISMPQCWDTDNLDTLTEYLCVEYPKLTISHHRPNVPILIIVSKEEL